MRHLAKTLSAIFFATMTSCAALEEEPTLDTDVGDTGPGAGAMEDFSGGGDTVDIVPDDHTDDGGDDTGGDDTHGGDDTGGGDTGGGDTGGGDTGGGDGGTCPSETTCSGDDDGDLPPPPPPTCDHDNDGDCDGGDCDHDNDGDCDNDDGGNGGHQEGQCAFTQGFWKNHSEDWPVSSLTLGSRSYTQAQLLVILRTETNGNGLLILAHQLIAAKLNVAAGAPSAAIADEIAEADALIGNLVVGSDSLPSSATSSLADELDEFNNSEAECE